MINVTVKMFAVARDLSGVEDVLLELPPSANASSLLEELVRRYPGLVGLKDHVRIAVNCEYVPLSRTLRHQDEVAIIPPVSGG